MWIALVLLLFQCNTKQNQDAADQGPPPSPDPAPKDDQFYGPRLIDVTSTAHLASSFLQLGKSMGNIDLPTVMVGMFDANVFDTTPGYVGVRLWYCYNASNSDYPKFFLAAERISAYNENDPEEQGSISEELFLPDLLPYQGDSDINSVETHLRTYAFGTNPTTPKTISKAMVLGFATEFRRLISGISPDPTRQKHPFSQYAVAYFKYNQDYNEFMAQNPKKVVYFLGYLPLQKYYPNYLRPVLGAIGQSDQLELGNVVKGTDFQSGGDNSLLQDSWPPPPPIR